MNHMHLIFLTDYVKELIRQTVYQCELGGSTTTSIHDIPQPLCSAYEHPNKETAIQEHKNRFKNYD